MLSRAWTVDTAFAFLRLTHFLLPSDTFSNLFFLKVSRGLIIAMYDDGLFPVLILDFPVGSGFLNYLCLLETHLLGLSDRHHLYIFCSFSDFFEGFSSSINWFSRRVISMLVPFCFFAPEFLQLPGIQSSFLSKGLYSPHCYVLTQYFLSGC